MPTNQSVIDVLLLTLENDPTNIAIRLHLAEVLKDDNRFEEAADQIQIVLSSEPANVEGLTLAATISENLGDLGKAAGYRKLINALNDSAEPLRPVFENLKDDWADLLEETSKTKVQQAAASDDFSDIHGDLVMDVEISDLKLDDVAGLEKVKKRLNLAFLSPLKNPEMMKLYGKSLRGGLLLYGPPGCGKTFIARAVAGELGARFISVGLADVLDMWIGGSEKNIHTAFEHARRNSPCVLFFDELDALGRKRSLMRSSGTGAINQLLSELDGMNQANEGVFVLAATREK